MTSSDPEKPRHLRLFELMRQRDVALDRASEAEELRGRRLEPSELERVQQIALRSFPKASIRPTRP
ncbi:MAG: hypothetical protein ABJ263_16575 [Tateyamaria sp.]|uniref:hypothetical protein n=1 Tax=Tateyamaria sp. TaxID=1929288 RepID=UPI0032708F39